jgi:hypothetical protein
MLKRPGGAPRHPLPAPDRVGLRRVGETPADRLARAEAEEKTRPLRILRLVRPRRKT